MSSRSFIARDRRLPKAKTEYDRPAQPRRELDWDFTWPSTSLSKWTAQITVESKVGARHNLYSVIPAFMDG